jgi:IS1 family transposase
VGAGAAEEKSGGLTLEADELWSFVRNKRAQWWVWVALDAATRQVVAMVCGDRSARTAQCLWDALPDEYRDGATVCTDFWSAYRGVVPADRHAAAGKEAGLTCHVERFWCTVRQRCGRLVRKALSFSKCVWNHVGALWDFIRYYNASLQ